MTSSQSSNVTETVKKQLQELVPEAFKDGQLDVVALKNLLGTDATLRDESYALNWLGKSYARLLANENIRTWLKEDEVHNDKPENKSSQNLLIKGDNLEVLKHLVGAYREEVKMIYIDPPYNTGSDGFVYEDDRKYTVEQLSKLAGIDEDEAKRILEFTQAKSNSHSAWLTFMYPRLYIAKKLLRDDGVIFIQIDDNEQAQLKLVCDEVFGEENFISEICIKMSHLSGVKMSHKDKRISKIKEFILVYAKNSNSVHLEPVYIEGTWDDVLDRYDYFVEKSGGDCKQWGIKNLNAHMRSHNIDEKNSDKFKIENSDFIFRTATNSAFEGLQKNDFFEEITTPTGLNRFIYKGEEVLFASKKIKVINGKRVPVNLLGDIWTDIGINNLHNEGGVPFANGKKPLKLLTRLIDMCVKKDEQSIILDFFCGSGTTPHSVLELNSFSSKSNRQFIAVQIPENTYTIDTKSNKEIAKKGSEAAYKAGYKTIFDITKARIEKAAAKIKADNPEYPGDLGFRIYETVPLPEKYQDSAEELTENLELFDAGKLDQVDRHNLMRTWALQDNVPLTMDFTAVDFAGYTAYQAKHILYFIEPNLTLDAVIKMLEQLDNDPEFKPSRLVVFGYLLESKVQREMSEAVKHYNNRKGIELTLDVRY